jgi:hypothetical protein
MKMQAMRVDSAAFNGPRREVGVVYKSLEAQLTSKAAPVRGGGALSLWALTEDLIPLMHRRDADNELLVEVQPRPQKGENG